jgi:hypothetical protein
VAEAGKTKEAPISALGEKSPEAKEAKAPEALEAEGKEGTAVEDEAALEAAESKVEEDPEKPRKKGGFQRRIDKLNARYSEKEREVDYWKRQAMQVASESKKEPVAPASKPVSAEGKPNADNFDTHSAYVEALTDWKTEQKLNERDQKAAQASFKTEQAKVFEKYQERKLAFAEKNPDFDEVIDDVSDIQVSAAISDILLTSENGPEIAYNMAQNREEFARICKLRPLDAARAIGKIEATLSSKPSETKETKKITGAPEPLKPVGTGGKGNVQKTIFDPTLSQADYEKLRREQIKQRRQTG